ncbi:hypothetical protein RDI58_025874 [Solanum bulbocastanum]|uniref:Uncharacterized protein n=1 Tax=Solanum bulbocastanum TaxID=147425 RepID=A0AAN8SSV2_SOLBU
MKHLNCAKNDLNSQKTPHFAMLP